MSSQKFQSFDQFNDRASHVRVMRALVPFVWLRDRPDLKLRVILAFHRPHRFETRDRLRTRYL